MIVDIDPRSPTPPYEQLRGQIATLIGSRELAPGSRLPTVRQLAGDLGLAPNTVARAYRELESDGLLDTRGRNGTYVADHAPSVAPTERRAELTELARSFARTAQRLGIDLPAATRALQQAWPTDP